MICHKVSWWDTSDTISTASSSELAVREKSTYWEKVVAVYKTTTDNYIWDCDGDREAWKLDRVSSTVRYKVMKFVTFNTPTN